jgi:predicted dehydrogenase
MPSRRLTRRSALQSLTVGGAGLSVGFFSSLLPRPSRAANDALQIACIGVANRARANLLGVSGQAIVALCDVDADYLNPYRVPLAATAEAGPTFPHARFYHDYRELLDAESGRVDAVVVSTTDHHHVPAAIRAVRKGMHVYCEKPLGHTVAEIRLLTEEARRVGVATQHGTQIHAGDNYRRVVEIIRAGGIGAVTEVVAWFGKGWAGGERPVGGRPPPPNLHWDLWLGPAPERPYAAECYHPRQWRRWWDFGNGTFGDMGCHYLDLVFWALDLDYPTACMAEGPPVHSETCPPQLTVHYEFPARGDHPPVTLRWHDGPRPPQTIHGHPVPDAGVMFVGSEGMLLADYKTHRLLPEEKFAGYVPPPRTIPDSIGHYAEWIQACRTGSPTTCGFDTAGPLAETVLLGTVAYRVGKRLEWDATALQATNAPEADHLIRKAYEPGWEVEEVISAKPRGRAAG